MFPHFDRRLQRDLQNIVDQRLAGSETASGGLMKVRQRFPRAAVLVCLTEYHKLISPLCACNLRQSSGVDVNVIAHKRQHIAVWSGGSILAENVSCPSSSTASVGL